MDRRLPRAPGKGGMSGPADSFRPQGRGPAFPLANAALAPLRSAAEVKGSSDFSPLWAGQNASGCRAVPAGQITRELVGSG